MAIYENEISNIPEYHKNESENWRISIVCEIVRNLLSLFANLVKFNLEGVVIDLI